MQYDASPSITFNFSHRDQLPFLDSPCVASLRSPIPTAQPHSHCVSRFSQILDKEESEDTDLHRTPSNTTHFLVDPPDPFTIPDWAPGYTTTLSAFSLPPVPYYSFFHFIQRTITYLRGLRAGLRLPRSAPIPGGHFVHRSTVFTPGSLLLGFQLTAINSDIHLRFNETEGVLKSLKVYLSNWRSGSPMGANIALLKDMGRGGGEQIATGRIWGMIREIDGE